MVSSDLSISRRSRFGRSFHDSRQRFGDDSADRGVTLPG
jgi:hypothetical protein